MICPHCALDTEQHYHHWTASPDSSEWKCACGETKPRTTTEFMSTLGPGESHIVWTPNAAAAAPTYFPANRMTTT